MRSMWLSLIVPCVAGCGVFGTSLHFGTNVAGSHGQGSGAPAASRGEVPPASQTEKGIAARAAYEKAYLASTQAIFAQPADSDAARDAARACSKAANNLIYEKAGGGWNADRAYDANKETIDTNNGPRTLAALEKECDQLLTKLIHIPVKGCGSQQLYLRSVSLGGGAWAPPDIWLSDFRADDNSADAVKSHERWDHQDCSKMPKENVIDQSLADHTAEIMKACGPSAIAVLDGGWHTKVLTNGAVQRWVEGQCWKQGEMKMRF